MRVLHETLLAITEQNTQEPLYFVLELQAMFLVTMRGSCWEAILSFDINS